MKSLSQCHNIEHLRQLALAKLPRGLFEKGKRLMDLSDEELQKEVDRRLPPVSDDPFDD